jgi:hypothetical protein
MLAVPKLLPSNRAARRELHNDRVGDGEASKVVGKKVDTPRGVTRGGGGTTGPSPELRDRVISGDRNTGRLADKRKPHRDKGEGGRAAGKRSAKTR